MAAGEGKLTGSPRTRGYRPSISAYPAWYGIGWGAFNLMVVDTMVRDPVVKLALGYKKSPLFIAEFEITADTPDVQKFVDATVKRFWQTSLQTALQALDYGYTGAEALYEDRPGGLVAFNRLRHLHPRDVVPWVKNGVLQKVEVKGIKKKGSVFLEASKDDRPCKGFWMVYEPEYNEWYGRSILMAPWWPWRLKTMEDGAMENLFKWAYKHSMSCTVIRHPDITVENGPQGIQYAQDLARELVQNVKAGGVITMSNAVDPDTKNYQWQIESWAEAKPGGEKIIEYIDFLDKQITRGVLVPDEVISHDGNGLPLDAPVLAPSGWVPIGSVAVGDKLVDPMGGDSVVTGVYPQGVRPIYRVNFSDGKTIVADEQHRWTVHYRDMRGEQRVLTTAEMIVEMKKGYKLFLPSVEPAIVEPRGELPLDPYLVGVLIGDGSLSGSNVVFTSADQEIVDSVRLAVPCGATVAKLECRKTGLDYIITNGDSPISIRIAIKGLGINKRSFEKFIPEAYLWASVSDRVALLQGLMDTDGTADLMGRSEYCTTSHQLAKDVEYLVRSLGGKASVGFVDPPGRSKAGFINGHQVVNKLRSYRVKNIRFPWDSDINPFRLSRKAQRFAARKRRTLRGWAVKSIEPCGETETVCISVSAPSCLYFTDHFIPTHNTGGYSRSQVAQSSFFVAAERILNHVLEVFQDQIMKPLVKLNFGNQHFSIKPKPLLPPEDGAAGGPGGAQPPGAAGAPPSTPPGAGGSESGPDVEDGGGDLPPLDISAKGLQQLSLLEPVQMAVGGTQWEYWPRSKGQPPKDGGWQQSNTGAWRRPKGSGAGRQPAAQPQPQAGGQPQGKVEQKQPGAEGASQAREQASAEQPGEQQYQPETEKAIAKLKDVTPENKQKVAKLLEHYAKHPEFEAALGTSQDGFTVLAVKNRKTGAFDPQRSRLVPGGKGQVISTSGEAGTGPENQDKAKEKYQQLVQKVKQGHEAKQAEQGQQNHSPADVLRGIVDQLRSLNDKGGNASQNEVIDVLKGVNEKLRGVVGEGAPQEAHSAPPAAETQKPVSATDVKKQIAEKFTRDTDQWAPGVLNGKEAAKATVQTVADWLKKNPNGDATMVGLDVGNQKALNTHFKNNNAADEKALKPMAAIFQEELRKAAPHAQIQLIKSGGDEYSAVVFGDQPIDRHALAKASEATHQRFRDHLQSQGADPDTYNERAPHIGQHALKAINDPHIQQHFPEFVKEQKEKLEKAEKSKGFGVRVGIADIHPDSTFGELDKEVGVHHELAKNEGKVHVYGKHPGETGAHPSQRQRTQAGAGAATGPLRPQQSGGVGSKAQPGAAGGASGKAAPVAASGVIKNGKLDRSRLTKQGRDMIERWKGQAQLYGPGHTVQLKDEAGRVALRIVDAKGNQVEKGFLEYNMVKPADAKAEKKPTPKLTPEGNKILEDFRKEVKFADPNGVVQARVDKDGNLQLRGVDGKGNNLGFAHHIPARHVQKEAEKPPEAPAENAKGGKATKKPTAQPAAGPEWKRPDPKRAVSRKAQKDHWVGTFVNNMKTMGHDSPEQIEAAKTAIGAWLDQNQGMAQDKVRRVLAETFEAKFAEKKQAAEAPKAAKTDTGKPAPQAKGLPTAKLAPKGAKAEAVAMPAQKKVPTAKGPEHGLADKFMEKLAKRGYKDAPVSRKKLLNIIRESGSDPKSVIDRLNGLLRKVFPIKAGVRLSHGEFSHGCLLFKMPMDVAAQVKEMAAGIPDHELADKGREDDIHLTLLYGLDESVTEADVRYVLDECGPIAVRLGQATLFQNDEANVLKIEVEGPDIYRLNAMLRQRLPHVETHPDYHPHVTVAYLKKDCGYGREGFCTLTNVDVFLPVVTFSSADGETAEIPLIEGVQMATVVPQGGGAPFQIADHAPKGGINIRGHYYGPGQFIPAGVLQNMTPEEMAALRGEKPPEQDPYILQQQQLAELRGQLLREFVQAGKNAIKDGSVMPASMAEALQGIQTLTQSMSVGSLKRLLANLRGRIIIGSQPQAMAEKLQKDGVQAPEMPDGAAWVLPENGQGTLYFAVDGDNALLSLAHALGHVADQTPGRESIDELGSQYIAGYKVSETPEWNTAWQRELTADPTSHAMVESPGEAFAEYARYVWTKTREAQKEYPMAWHVWEREHLV